MFSYQSVNGPNIVGLEDSEKNGNFWKTTFYPKMMFFSEYLKFSIFSQNNDLPQKQSCKFHFLRGKRHTDMAIKRGQPFKWLKLLWWFPIDREKSIEFLQENVSFLIEIKAFFMIYSQFEVKTLLIMSKCQFSIFW